MSDALFGPLLDVFRSLAVLGGGTLIAGAVIALWPGVIGFLRQHAYDRATERDRQRWALRLDPGSAADRDAARRLIAALHPGGRRGVSAWSSGWPRLVLDVRWVGGLARWEIDAPRQLARAVETAVAAAFPGAELDRLEPSTEGPAAMRLALRGEPPTEPLARTATDFGAILVELLARLPAGASASWRLRVSPLPVREEARSADVPGPGEMLLDSFLNRPSRSLPSASTERSTRAPGPLFSVTASLEATAASPAAVRAWLFDAMGAVGSLRAAGWRIETTVGGRSSLIQATAQDLADLWGLAGAGSDSRPVDAIRSRRLPPPIVAVQPGLRSIGLDGGRPVLVPDDLFARHAVLLGRTGAGKSTELVALAADDIRSGRGLTFLDPHGDAVARLLDATPAEQAHRVHLLELAEKDRPRAFNPIELDGADPELVAAQFVDTMRDLYFATLGSAHRQIQYLRNALMTLLTMPPGTDGPWTLDSLYSLFVDPTFRENFTRGLEDPVLAAFWKHQWQQDSRRGNDPSADAILSKLGAFLSYPSIRAIVSAPVSTIRPRRIMDAGDVLLVDLSGVGRDHMRLFGSLLIARYGVAALGRQRVPGADRTPHTLYVDEVQNFDTSSLRGIPAEGRKFGLWIVMATQYLRGLGMELQSAIRANVATMMLLQPSAEDAGPLADLVAPLTERDLINLPRFRMAVRTELGGETSVLTADVLPESPDLGSGELVRRLSDERDGRPRGE
jgi:uncharacterized protein DUF87